MICLHAHILILHICSSLPCRGIVRSKLKKKKKKIEHFAGLSVLVYINCHCPEVGVEALHMCTLRA